jgi:preprotein translocase subunit SecG
MGIIGILLLVIFVASSLLLIAMILIQDDQGEGLGGIFGGGSGTPFGSRSGNVLTRFTTILGAVFLLTSLGLAWTNRTVATDDVVGTARRIQTTGENKVDWWKVDKTQAGQTAPANQATPLLPTVPAPAGATDGQSAPKTKTGGN